MQETSQRPRPTADTPRRRRALVPVLAAVCSGAAGALLVLLEPSAALPLLAVAMAVVIVSFGVAVLQLRLSTLLSASVCLQVFSGNWQYLGLPLGLDRLLLLAALAACLRDLLSGRIPHAVRIRPVHVALALMTTVAVVSALFAGTLLTPAGGFALLDRLGFVPFLAFLLAPLAFRTAADRDRLLVTFVVTGAFLGLTALLEGVGLNRLSFPPYIADESLGIHQGRARGPFLEAVANGLALYVCAVASCVALATWHRPLARRSAGVVAALCMLGTVFTLTRAVWLAAVVASLVAALTEPRLRRLLLPAAVTGVATVGLALLLVPGLSDRISERSGDQRSLWDRYNTNAAAVRIVEERALSGVGWQRFAEVAPDYLRQSERYPLTGSGIEVHNVPLSHAAELGLPAAALFLLCLLLAVGHGLVRGPAPGLAHWRVGLWAVAGAWAIIASFGPLSYAFPNTVLWLWAGLVLGPYLLTGRRRGGLTDDVTGQDGELDERRGAATVPAVSAL